MSIFRKNEIRKAAKVIEPEIQIMMLGARRTGKTSMLASMYNSFSNVVAGTNLTISKKGGKAIDDSLEHMKALFRVPHMLNEPVPGVSDFTQTQGFDKIDFQLTITGKKSIKPKVIRYVDCSGEWINNRSNEDELGEEIEKSEVVIITVDSVLLMEENGKYNKQNSVQAITEFIKNNMNPDSMINSKKMVLFVLTKCERYMHQNADRDSIFYNKRMAKLTQKVHEEYSALFNFLTSPNNTKYFTVAILPVITLGGIEFDGFLSEDDSEILTDAIQYRYCTPDRFAPEYCDRPLIYSLLFVQKKISQDYYKKAYNSNSGKKKVTATIKEWFLDMQNAAKDTDYIHELNKVIELLKEKEYPGFNMVQDPDSIELKVQSASKG